MKINLTNLFGSAPWISKISGWADLMESDYYAVTLRNHETGVLIGIGPKCGSGEMLKVELDQEGNFISTETIDIDSRHGFPTYLPCDKAWGTFAPPKPPPKRETPGVLNKQEALQELESMNMSGWAACVDKLYDELPDDVSVIAIGQKYAVIDIALTRYDEKLSELNNELQAMSSTLCQICGKPGEWCIDKNEWEYTLCETHRKEINATTE